MHDTEEQYSFTSGIVIAVVILGGVSVLFGVYYLFDYFRTSSYSRDESSFTMGLLGVGTGFPTLLIGLMSNVVINVAKNTEKSARSSLKALDKLGYLETELKKLNKK